MSKLPVTYKNKVVGYTYDGGKTIIFSDKESEEEIMSNLQSQPIFVSSRGFGEIDEKGKVYKEEKISLDILKLNNDECN